MTDIENREIRGITGRLVAAVLLGSASVVIAILTGIGHIERTFALHEYRISQLENRCGIKQVPPLGVVNYIEYLREQLVFDEPKSKMSLN